MIPEVKHVSATAMTLASEAQAGLLRTDRRNRALSRLRKRLAVLGVPIDNLTLEEAVGIMERYIEQGGFHQIATANVDFLTKAIHDSDLMDILHNCSLVLADGMPIVWASRILKHPLRERVTGADLVPQLVALAARKSYGIYLLGAEEDRSAAAAIWINSVHPAARLVGRCSPPFTSLDEMDHEQILRDIEKTRPDILLVAFGNPKQEKWLAMHRHRLTVPVCVGVGASLDFLSGVHHRAPSAMQSLGLEWLHRLAQEPGRLGPRYLSNASGLLRYLSVQLLTMSTQRQTRAFSLSHHQLDNSSVVTVSGRFSGALVTDFESLLNRISTHNCPLVIDLSATEHIGADALGALISLRNRMQQQYRPLWLVGVKPGVRRVLRASILDSRFHFAHDVTHATNRIGYIDVTTSKQSATSRGRHALRQGEPST